MFLVSLLHITYEEYMMLKKFMVAFSIAGLIGISAVASAAPYPRPAELIVTNADNGQTVNLFAGQRLSVSLDSTYWRFDSTNYRPVLSTMGQPQYQTDPSALPGSGKGVAIEQFKAKTAGQVTVSAHRNACGEAMRCVPAQNFQVYVIVHYQE
jgi:hypothetical protein